MAVLVTQAAAKLDQANVSPHKLISLLMEGTLERIAQARACIVAGETEDKDILLSKIKAIIKGLRESLDFEHGGEIAINLDSLYEYMIGRLASAECVRQEQEVLKEVEQLMTQVKDGWDGIDQNVAA